MAIYFTFILLATTLSESVSTIFHSSGCYTPAIAFYNSTSQFTFLSLHHIPLIPSVHVSKDSNLQLQSCAILNTNGLISSAFEAAGTIHFQAFSILSSSEYSQVLSFVSNHATHQYSPISSTSLVLADSRFSGVMLLDSEATFLSDGLYASHRIHNCVFRNISTTRDILPPHKQFFASVVGCAVRESEFSNSEVIESDDWLYGHVSTGVSYKTLNRFTALNSTFHRCSRDRNPPGTPPPTHRLLHNTDCDLPVSSSVPSMTKTDCDQTQHAQIEKASDDECVYILTRCIFRSSSLTSNDNSMGGGGLYARGGTVYYGQLLNLTSTAFVNCTASTQGGGLGVYYMNTTTIEYCTFMNCSAGSNGGGVALMTLKNRTMRYCYFGGNTAPNGHDIYLNDMKSGYSLDTFSNFYCVPSDSTGRIYNNSAKTKSSDSGFSQRSKIYVASKSRNYYPLCMDYTDSTCTLLDALSVANTYSFTHTFNLLSGSHPLSSTFSVGTQQISIVNATYSRPTITISGEESSHTFSIWTGTLTISYTSLTISKKYSANYNLFYLFYTGTLTLNYVSISSSTSYTSSGSVFSIGSGTLSISHSNVSTIVLGSCPLISYTTSTSPSLTFTDTNFTGITRTSGNGAIFEVTIANNGNFSLSNIACTTCVCNSSTAVVGPIYISLTGTPTTLLLQSLTFSGCTYGSSTKTRNIYVSCSDATTSLAQTMFPFVTASSSSDENLWWGHETITTRFAFDAPLLHFFYPPITSGSTVEKMYVAKRGKSFTNCGWSDTPCASLNYAYTNRGTLTKFVLLGTSNAGDTFAYPATTTNFGVGTLAGSAWEVEIGGTWTAHVFAVSGGTCTAGNMTLSLTVALGASLFSVTDSTATLSLQRLTVKATNTLSFTSPLVAMDAGTLSASSVSFTAITTTNCPLISVSQTSSSPSTLTFTSSSFTSLTRTQGNGVVLNLGATDYVQLTLSQTTFTNCACTGTGTNIGYGALYFNSALTQAGNTFTFNNVAFSADTSITDHKKAGIYVVEESLDPIFGSIGSLPQWLSDLLSSSYSTYGSDPDLYWGIATGDPVLKDGFSLLHVKYPVSDDSELATVYVDGRGEDYQEWRPIATCGWRDIPCPLLSSAVDHAQSWSEFTVGLLLGTHKQERTGIVFDAAQTITIGSISASVVTISVPALNEGEGVFVLSHSSALLTFSTALFLLSSASPLTTPLFFAHLGFLTLTTVTVKPDTEVALSSQLALSHSLIKIEEGAGVSLNVSVERILLNTQNGTLLSGIMGSDRRVSVTQTTVTNCTALYGGAIYLSLPSTPSLTFSVVQFDNCNAANEIHLGSNAYFESASITPFIRSSQSWMNGLFATLYDAESEADTAYGASIDTINQIAQMRLQHLQYTPIEGHQTDCYVAGQNAEGRAEWVDSETCGWPDVPCKFLSQGVTQFTQASTATYTVHLTAGTHESETSALQFTSGVTATIAGVSGTQKKVTSMSGASLLSVSGAALSLQSISFDLNGVTSLTTGLLTVDAGTVEVSGVSVKGDGSSTSLSHPIILHTGGSFSLTSSSFSNLLLLSGGGSVLRSTLTSSTSLTIGAGNTFSSCSTQSGNGGAIHVTINQAPSVLSLSSMTFSACSAGGDGNAGNGIYIASHLESTFTSDDCLGMLPQVYTLDNEAKFYGSILDSNDSPVKTFSLLHLKYGPGSNLQVTGLHVGTNVGYDLQSCGWSDLPCKTLDHALSIRQTMTTVSINTETSLNTYVSVTNTQPLTIKQDSVSTLTVGSTLTGTGSTSLVSNSGTVHVYFLNLYLPASISSITYLFDSSNLLQLEKVSFLSTSSDELPTISYTLIHLSAGIFAASDVTLESFALTSTHGPISLSPLASRAELERWNVNTISLSSSFITIEDQSSSSLLSITLTDSNFTSLSTTSTSITVPTLLSSATSSNYPLLSFTLSNCNVTDCVNQKSKKGGAILFGLVPNSELNIIGGKAADCQCSTEDAESGSEGRGGFLYLDAAGSQATSEFNDTYLPISIQSITFNSNQATIGKDIFIHCHSFSNQLVEELIVLDFQTYTHSVGGLYGTSDEHTDTSIYDYFYIVQYEEVFVNSQESDAGECGTDSSPCQTITIGVKHLQPSDTSTLNVVGSSSFNNPTLLNSLTLKSSTSEKSTVTMNEELTSTKSGWDSLIRLTGFVCFDLLNFVVGPSLTIAYDNVFAVTGLGNLIATSCTFTSTHPSLPYTLISLTDALSLTFENVEVSDFRLTSSPLILLATCLAQFTVTSNSRFENIKRESGSGAVFSGKISSKTTFSLDGVTFTTCASTSDENAVSGAIDLSLNPPPLSFAMKNSHFIDCTFGSATPTQRSVYLRCGDATTLLSPEKWTGTLDKRTSEMSEEEWQSLCNIFTVEEAIASRAHYTTSVYYFLHKPEVVDEGLTIIVGTTGNEWPAGVSIETCGWYLLPCNTIQTAKQKYSATITGVKLLAGSHSGETSVVRCAKSESFSGSTDTPSDTVLNVLSPSIRTDPVFLIQLPENQQTVSFTSMKFSLEAGAGCVIKSDLSSLGTTTLSNIIFEGDGQIENGPILSLVISESGSLKFDTVSFTQIQMNNLPVIQVTLSHTEEKKQNLTLNGLSLSGCSSSEGASIVDISARGKPNTFEIGSIEIDTVSTPVVKVTCVNGEDLLKKESLGVVSAYSIADKEKFVVVDETSGRATVTAPLSHFAFSPTCEGSDQDDHLTLGSISQNRKGIDFTHCGWDDIPCGTLNYLAENYKETMRQVSVTCEVHPSEEYGLTVDATWTLTGSVDSNDNTRSTQNVKALTEGAEVTDALFVVCQDCTLNVATMKYTLDSTAPHVIKTESDGAVVLTDVILTQSEVATALGVSVIDASLGMLRLVGTTFVSLTLTSAPLLSVSPAPQKFSMNKLVETDTPCTFERILRMNGNGAVFSVTVTDNDLFEIDNVAFKECWVTNGFGGSVGVNVSGTGQIHTGSNIDFAPSEGTKDSKGSFLFISSISTDWFTEQVSQRNADSPSGLFQELFPLGEENYQTNAYWGEVANENEHVSFALLHYLSGPTEGTLVIGGKYEKETGLDVQSCGWDDLPCQTIKYAMEKETTQSLTLTLTQAVHSPETSSVTFSAGTYVIKEKTGAPTKSVTKVDDDKCVFVVSEATVTIQTVIFELNTDTDTSLTNSLFDLQTGELTLSHITVRVPATAETSLTLTSSLINLQPSGSAAFTIEACSFSDVILSSGDGSVISALLTDRHTLTIGENNIFKNCATANGNGGAISLQLSGDPTLSFKTTTIINCKAGGEGKKGDGVFISSPTVSIFSAQKGVFDILPSEYDPELDEVYVACLQDSDDTLNQVFSLSHLQHRPAMNPRVKAVITTDNTRVESPKCGWSDLPCTNLADAVTNRGSIQTVTVTASSHLTSGWSLMADLLLFIQSTSDTEQAAVSVASRMQGTLTSSTIITVLGNLSVSLIDFSLPSSAGNADCFMEASSYVSLTHVTIKSDGLEGNSICMSIVKLTYGDLILVDLNISSATFTTTHSPFYLETSTVLGSSRFNQEVSETTDGDTSDDETTEADEQTESPSVVLPSIQMTNCSFTALTFISTEPAGVVQPSLLYAPSAITTTLTNCTFDDCKSEASLEGGAIYLCLTNDGALAITNGTTRACKASQSDGRGGFLFLSCTGDATFDASPLPLSIRDLTFSDNAAKVGADIFIRCYSLAQQLTTSQFHLDWEAYIEEQSQLHGTSLRTLIPAEVDIPIYGFVYIYQSKQIFLSGSGNNSAKCGKEGGPCASIVTALEHFEEEQDGDEQKTLIVNDEADVDKAVHFDQLTLQGQKDEETQKSSVINLLRTEESVDANTGTIVLAEKGVEFTTLTFILDDEFKDTPGSFIHVEPSGDLTVTDTLFKAQSALDDSCQMIHVEGLVTFTECKFDGSNSATVSNLVSLYANEEQTSTEMCAWTGSLVKVTGRSAEVSFDRTAITNSSTGGLAVLEDALVTITQGTFADNNPNIEGYSCMRKNIICNDSTVDVQSILTGDGKEANSSLWITGNKYCRLKGVGEDYVSWFYVPKYENITWTDHSDVKQVDLVFTGKNFIPCNLTVSLSLSGLPVTFSLTSLNETAATLTLANDAYDMFMNSATVSISGEDLELKGPDHLSQSSQSSNNTFLVAIAIGLGIVVAALIIGIIVVYAVQSRKPKRQTTNVVVQLTDAYSDMKGYDDQTCKVEVDPESAAEDSDALSELEGDSDEDDESSQSPRPQSQSDAHELTPIVRPPSSSRAVQITTDETPTIQEEMIQESPAAPAKEPEEESHPDDEVVPFDVSEEDSLHHYKGNRHAN